MRTVVNCDNGQYQRVCRGEFEQLHTKLDRLDEAIRGNGAPGINRRLDRLENIEASRAQMRWLLIGAAFTLGTGLLLQLAQLVLTIGK